MRQQNYEDPENNFNRLAEFISNLIWLLLMTAIISFVTSFCVDNPYIKGEWMGIGFSSLFIFLTIIGFIRSFFSDEDFKNIYDEAKREAEEIMKQYEEEKKKLEEDRDKKKNNDRSKETENK